MVLLAICDSRYCFSFVDVGEYGSNNDSGVLKNSRMGNMSEREEMNLPESETIEGDKLQMPYFLVEDEIFPLKNWLMRPYSGKSLVNEKRKIFNYRLSRTRRIIENTFGIIVARWRIFQTTINAEPERVEKIVFACVALHNYLMLITLLLGLLIVRANVEISFQANGEAKSRLILWKVSNLFEVYSTKNRLYRPEKTLQSIL